MENEPIKPLWKLREIARKRVEAKRAKAAAKAAAKRGKVEAKIAAKTKGKDR